MVAIAICPSCQLGEHNGHIASWKPAPPGVFGGFYCVCEGSCANEMGELIERLFGDMGGSDDGL